MCLMHVGLVNKYYCPPHLGGVEQSLNLLARSLVADGNRVTALVANEGPRAADEVLDGVEVRRLGRSFAFASTPIALSMRGEIRRLAMSDSIDVFHLHFPYPWGEMSWLSAGVDTPAVLTYHADVVRQKHLMATYAPWLRRVLDRVDRIIVGAPQMIENSPFLAPVAEKCRVVPFAIEYGRFTRTAKASATVARRLEGVRGPLVLFVGRLVYYKGIDVLVEAMADVSATLVVIGRGPLEAELRDKALALGISERILWVEPVSDSELAAWYDSADVFCLPSTARSEAYGLVQLEAHYAGTPVVSTALPTGVPYVNQDGLTGLVVPPGDSRALADALNRLLADDELRERFGRQARERAVTDFSIERMVSATIAVYREAIELHTD